LAVIPRLPRGAVLALSRWLAAVAYLVARGTRQVGLANLDLAFGEEKSDREKRAILRSSFRTFALVMLDILWFTRNSRARVQRYVRLDQAEREILAPGPQLCVTAHLGNWEVLGQAVNAAGFPIHSVAAPLENPGVDELFVPMRELTGQRILPRQGVLRSMLRVFRNGERVGILLDQNTKPSEGGVFFPFFGVPVPVAVGASTLALRTGAQVATGFCLPQRDGTYRVYISATMQPSDVEGEEKADVLTAVILAHIEEAVRRDPGCWLWMYKRWRLIAPEADPDLYPFYAHPMSERETADARCGETTGL
jgi:KDO2-lipid IV(A) lauroyltransferase